MATLSMTPGYLHKERKGEGKYIPSCSISRLLIAIDTRQFEITAAALNIHFFSRLSLTNLLKMNVHAVKI